MNTTPETRHDELFRQLEWGVQAIESIEVLRTDGYGDLIPRMIAAVRDRDFPALQALRREDFPYALTIGAIMEVVGLDS